MSVGAESDRLRDRQKDRASIIQLVVLGVIASILGIVLGLLIDWFPTQGSREAPPIDTLWDVLVIVSVPVFVGVTAVVLYCVWKFRMRPGQELQDGPPVHGNTRLEVIWTLIPAIVILALCTYAYFVLRDAEEAHANDMRITVTGQQFSWTFEYPQAGGQPVRSNELVLPEDRRVKFVIRSQDVLHSFWIPAFRMKLDTVPGINRSYRVTPTKRGVFPVVCAELCGLGHAYMRQNARVVSMEEFQRFVRAGGRRGATAQGGGGAGNTPGAAPAGTPVDGKTLFTQGNGKSTACGACHTLADANATGTTGPDLDKVLAGAGPDEIRKDIADPNAEIAKGYAAGIMPGNYEQVLSRQELDALVKYLDEVTK